LNSEPDTNGAGGGPVEQLRDVVAEAAGSVRGGAAEAPPASLERPPRAEFGDYSTNVALLLAPALKAPPREIAEAVGESLSAGLGDVVDRVEVAGPGFLNVFLADTWFRRALAQVRDAGERFGAGVIPADWRRRILVEFVSANPTGPITVASGRHAAYGDSLARVLAFGGHEIEREFYVNDYGTQIELFAKSIAARMHGDDPPENGYQGEYVAELAADLQAEGLDPDDLDALARRGVELMIERVRATLERFRARFTTRTVCAPRSRSSATSSCTSPKAPSGCARPGSATTRTACCSVPRASPRTSRPTSPITRTSAHAATTA
jgi:arginyl-tRNA synthetase